MNENDAGPCPSRRRVTMAFLRGALIALLITLIGGLLSVFYTVPWLAVHMQALGLDLRSLRPLHTTFATAWILIGGIAVVYRYMEDERPAISAPERFRVKAQVILWALAGAAVLVTIPMRITSGREYVGFHPGISILILGGWLLFIWNFWGGLGHTFWNRPIYVTMWGVGSLFFVYTFIEQHAYLLPGVFADPIVDKRIQWKACGTLVGSFNLFVYGSLIYTGERLSRDSSYGNSRIAYALFAVGLLNSFTNFGHHTYAIPQSHLVKWISFVISMTEIIILWRAATDVWKLAVNRTPRPSCATRALLGATKLWTMVMLASSILISIPPLNALIHGTYAVTGHAMGATIGIDTMALLAALSLILAERCEGIGLTDIRRALDSRWMQFAIIGLNLSIAALVLWLHIHGVVDGVTQWSTPYPERVVLPEWLTMWSPWTFAITGTLAFIAFFGILWRWLPLAFIHLKR